MHAVKFSHSFTFAMQTTGSACVEKKKDVSVENLATLLLFSLLILLQDKLLESLRVKVTVSR